jgi:hypothetical protein
MGPIPDGKRFINARPIAPQHRPIEGLGPRLGEGGRALMIVEMWTESASNNPKMVVQAGSALFALCHAVYSARGQPFPLNASPVDSYPVETKE